MRRALGVVSVDDGMTRRPRFRSRGSGTLAIGRREQDPVASRRSDVSAPWVRAWLRAMGRS